MKLPVIAVALAFFVGSCRPADQVAEDTAALDTTPAPAATPAAEVPGERTVHVVLAEWRVSPSETNLAPGRVTFHAMNEGQYQHALEVERTGQEWQTDPIAAGGTGAVTFDLTPGTYTLYCPIVDAQGNHRERGMQTTVTVR